MTATRTSAADADGPEGATGFTLAHLSDPHLTSLDGVLPGTLLDKRILGWLSWRRRRRFHHQPRILAQLVADIRSTGVDHTVVTGDLTHIGLPREVDAARSWLQSLGTDRDVTLIPGNHDLYVADADNYMLSQWAPWFSDQATPADASAVFPCLRIRGDVALIGTSSSVATPPGMATGTLGAAQLEALRSVLREQRAAGRYRIVMVHHAPKPGIDGWRKRLTDAPAMARLLAEEGSELVLHGHGHRARCETIDGLTASIPVLGASSASADDARADRRAAWYHIRITRSSGRWLTRAQLRSANGDVLAEHQFEAPASSPSPQSASSPTAF